MKGWWKYVACFVAGAVLALGLGFIFTRGATDKLRADLAGVRKSLELAQSNSADLTEQLRLVHGQLDRANSLVTRQQSELAGQQRTISGQQSIIDAQKRGLAKLADDLAGSGGDIGKQIRAFAEGFRRLYGIYHPGGK